MVMKKKVWEKGMPPVSHYFQHFDDGTKVIININPSVMKGMPHPRYQGKVATVVGRRGRAYVLELIDGGKSKIIISHPVHIRIWQ
jgi:large subunit ribosomal protein L21e